LLNYIYPEKHIENYPKLEIKLTNSEILNGKDILSNLFANKVVIIAVFTNATGDKKIFLN